MVSDNVRKLPIYLVLDCSGSMTGEPIEAVRQGLKALLSDLRSDPQALETAYLSVITFADEARQVSPLEDLAAFQEPQLAAGGYTALGAALKLLSERIGAEVRRSSKKVKGDYRPLVFLMTDGQPTDEWESAADAIKAQRLGNIVACAAGPHADEAMLRRLTESVVVLSSLQPDQLKAFFKWVSASIRCVSTSLSGGNAAGLPALPDGLKAAASPQAPAPKPKPAPVPVPPPPPGTPLVP